MWSEKLRAVTNGPILVIGCDIWLSKLVSWLYKISKEAIYLLFCSLGRVDISILFMAPENQSIMPVDQNEAILNDSGL